MINPTTLATARAAFAALDVTAENDSIAALEMEREQASAAIERAEARCTEISQALAAYVEPDHGEATADALLAGIGPREAADTGLDRTAMIEERAALRAGIGELRRRYDATYRQIIEVQRETFGRAGILAAPLADALFDRAREAAQIIVECYAALAAVESATRYGAGEVERMGRIAGIILSHDGLLESVRSIPVPDAISEVLRALQGKGTALPAGVLTAATPRDDRGHIAALAAVANRPREAA